MNSSIGLKKLIDQKPETNKCNRMKVLIHRKGKEATQKIRTSKVKESQTQLPPHEREDQTIVAYRLYQRFAQHKELLSGNFVVLKSDDWDMLWQKIGCLNYIASLVSDLADRRKVQNGIKELKNVVTKSIRIS